MTPQQMVEEFYETKTNGLPDDDLALDLVMEEFDEWLHAPQHSTEDLKEIVDVVYTLLGVCIVRGYDFDRAFALVHASNMTKERTESGKVLKGPNYVAPDLSGCTR